MLTWVTQGRHLWATGTVQSRVQRAASGTGGDKFTHPASGCSQSQERSQIHHPAFPEPSAGFELENGLDSQSSSCSLVEVLCPAGLTACDPTAPQESASGHVISLPTPVLSFSTWKKATGPSIGWWKTGGFRSKDLLAKPDLHATLPFLQAWGLSPRYNRSAMHPSP